MIDGIAPVAAKLQPVSGRNVWYGPEMARRQDWIRQLTDAEIAALDTVVTRLDATGIDIGAIDAAQVESPVLHGLIDEIRHAVLHGTGFILVRGVPVER